MDNQKELFPVVDEEGNVLGSISRGEAHNGTKILHPVVHLHVFLIQRVSCIFSIAQSGKIFSQTNGTPLLVVMWIMAKR